MKTRFYMQFLILMIAAVSLMAKPSKLEKQIIGDWRFILTVDYGDTTLMNDSRVLSFDGTTAIFSEDGYNDLSQYTIVGDTMKVESEEFQVKIIKDTLKLIDEEKEGAIINGALLVRDDKKGAKRVKKKKTSRAYRKYSKKILGDWKVVKGEFGGQVMPVPEGESMEFRFKEGSVGTFENGVLDEYQPYTISDNYIIANGDSMEIIFDKDTFCMVSEGVKIFMVETTIDLEEYAAKKRTNDKIDDAVVIVRQLMTALAVYEAETAEFISDPEKLGVNTESDMWDFVITLGESDYTIKASVKPGITIGDIGEGEYFTVNTPGDKAYSHSGFATAEPYFFKEATLIAK